MNFVCVCVCVCVQVSVTLKDSVILYTKFRDFNTICIKGGKKGSTAKEHERQNLPKAFIAVMHSLSFFKLIYRKERDCCFEANHTIGFTMRNRIKYILLTYLLTELRSS
jgi:hypothetical protein